MIDKKILKMIGYLKFDKTSGANEFIDKVIEIINKQIHLIKDPYMNIEEDIMQLSEEIINVRPSMAPLINTIGYLIHDVDIYNKFEMMKKLNEFENVRSKREGALNTVFQKFIRSLNKENLNIMLISYSSTIFKLLSQSEGQNFTFYILESRPLFEGRHTAKLLSKKFETHLIVDSAMGKFINQVDFVFFGIDSVLKDGSVVNKIGTYPLACIAHANNKLVYTIGDSFKYSLKSHYGQPTIIEKKPIYEVYSKRIKTNLFKVHNYYFDITPLRFINGIISDLGILTMEEFLNVVQTILPIEWYKQFLTS